MGATPVLFPGDDLDRVVDELTALGYGNEFCLAPYVDPNFLRNLAYAGFLVMSTAGVLDARKTNFSSKTSWDSVGSGSEGVPRIPFGEKADTPVRIAGGQGF